MLDLNEHHPSLAAAAGSSGSGAGTYCIDITIPFSDLFHTTLTYHLTHPINAGICCLASLPLSQTTTSSNFNSSLVVVGYTGGYVCVVDAGRGRRVEAIHRPHRDDVRNIAVCTPWSTGSSSSGSGSGNLESRYAFGLATTSFDGCAALWNVDLDASHASAAAKTFTPRGLLRGHADKVLGVSIVSNRSGEAYKKVVTSGADGQVILWDPQSASR